VEESDLVRQPIRIDEHYQRIKETADPRRAYGASETPPDIAALFGDELDRRAKSEGYDDER
jgi:hypothetical protein